MLDFKPYIESIVLSGLVIECLISARLSTADIATMRRESWAKEISVMEGTRRASELNYRCWLEPNYSEESIHPELDANPEMNRYIHGKLVEWRTWTSRIKRFFPRFNRKTISASAQRDFQESFPFIDIATFVTNDDKFPGFSQAHVEKAFIQLNYLTLGVCEMRQRIQRSGLSPRTYYACGGKEYIASRYLPSIFNKLVDILPCSEHRMRLNPSRLELDDEEDFALIYDLWAFTSNFHEHVPFLRALARFCRGVTITTFDGNLGYMSEDLGSMIDHYCDVTTDFPEYSRERYDRRTDSWIYRCHQHVAGFLGVFGNLAVCTFVHAATVLTVIGSPQKLYTAGDDGGAVVKSHLMFDSQRKEPNNSFYDDSMVLFRAISLLGVVAWSKVFFTYEEGSVALKRPIHQLGKRILTTSMVIWPSYPLIDAALRWNTYNDPRYPEIKAFHTHGEVIDTVIGEVHRFMEHVSVHADRLIVEECDEILYTIQCIYEVLRFPLQGSLGSSRRKSICPCPMVMADLSRNPYERLIEQLYPGEWRVPLTIDDEREFDLSSEIIWKRGSFHQCVLLDGEISYFRKLGYLVTNPLHRTLYGEEGYLAAKNQFLRLVRYTNVLVDVTVVDIPPLYTQEIIE